MSSFNHVMSSLADDWSVQFEAAKAVRSDFLDVANVMREMCYDVRYRRIYEHADLELSGTPFRMTYNKVGEFVRLNVPHCFHQNPVRTVKPKHLTTFRKQPAEQAKDRLVSGCLGDWLNMTPRETHLKRESIWAIHDALLTGAGCLWLTVDPAAGTVGQEFDSVDRLLIDADADRLEHAQWIARQRWAPAWWVAQTFKIPVTDLPSRYMPGRQEEGQTQADRVMYYEVYSRIGMGGRLGALRKHDDAGLAMEEDLRERGLQDWVRLIVAPDFKRGILNMQENQTPEQAIQAMQWPVNLGPDGSWPLSRLQFLPTVGGDPSESNTYADIDRPGIWPTSILKLAYGELVFLTWAYSHLCNKIQTTSRDLVVVAKSLEDNFRQALATAGDLTVVPVPDNVVNQLARFIEILQHPPMNQDIYQIVAAVEAKLSDRLGMTDIQTGRMSKQMRTHAEAAVRGSFARVLPESMADAVDDWQSECAAKEAIASRTLLRAYNQGQLTPFGQRIGQVAGQMWDAYVSTTPELAAREMEYTVLAGSARRPDKQADQEDVRMLGQTLLPIISQWAITGDVEAINAFILQASKAFDFDPAPWFLKPNRLLMMQAAMAGQPSGGSGPQGGKKPSGNGNRPSAAAPQGSHLSPGRLSVPPGGKPPGIPAGRGTS